MVVFCRYLWLSSVGIYGGFLLGVRSVSGLAFYDWETNALVRRIEITPKMVRNGMPITCSECRMIAASSSTNVKNFVDVKFQFWCNSIQPIKINTNLYVSHGGATKCLRNGDEYYIYFVDNLLLFLKVKEFSKLVNSWWSYCKKFDTTFFLRHSVWSADTSCSRQLPPPSAAAATA